MLVNYNARSVIKLSQVWVRHRTVVSSSAAMSQQTSNVADALSLVRNKMKEAQQAGNYSKEARLVAVSKTKPVGMLQEAYDAGQRVFGENYPQELVEKAPQLPKDIQWHFIGHVQSSNAKMLVEIPNLAMVETIDSVKLANKLHYQVEKQGRDELNIMIQVNTSGEDSKFGVVPDDVEALAKHIATECPKLRLRGAMTIGKPDYTSAPEDFEKLKECRDIIAKVLHVDAESLELSMGMSGDYELAIRMGSTNIRVGSTIFGARSYPKKA